MLPIVRSRVSRLALAAMLVWVSGPAYAQITSDLTHAPKPPSSATIAAQQAATAALPPESGLELVETRFAPAPVVDDAPPPPRRVRPPRVVLDEQPLQFVETRKDSPPPA